MRKEREKLEIRPAELDVKNILKYLDWKGMRECGDVN